MTYTRLLIPLDGSTQAEQVLSHARFFARALNSPVELLEVINPDIIANLSDPKQGRPFEIVLSERRRTCTDYLNTIAGSFDSVTSKCIVESGNPEKVVIERAATDHSTLIAMSSSDRSRIMRRWLFGNLPENILRSGTNHLLLVHASDQDDALLYATPKRVVVPLDGSRLAEKVLPYVAHLARKMQLEVILLRVLAFPVSIAAVGYWPDSGAFTSLLEPEGEYLAKKATQLKEKGLENVISIVKCGYIPGEIFRLVRTSPDSFVVMCTHGRSGIKSWAFESVAERVARRSTAPMLIIQTS